MMKKHKNDAALQEAIEILIKDFVIGEDFEINSEYLFTHDSYKNLSRTSIIQLTNKGIKKVQFFFRIDDINSSDYEELFNDVCQAIVDKIFSGDEVLPAELFEPIINRLIPNKNAAKKDDIHNLLGKLSDLLINTLVESLDGRQRMELITLLDEDEDEGEEKYIEFFKKEGIDIDSLFAGVIEDFLKSLIIDGSIRCYRCGTLLHNNVCNRCGITIKRSEYLSCIKLSENDMNDMTAFVRNAERIESIEGGDGARSEIDSSEALPNIENNMVESSGFYCPKCGNKIDKSLHSCVKCGFDIKKSGFVYLVKLEEREMLLVNEFFAKQESIDEDNYRTDLIVQDIKDNWGPKNRNTYTMENPATEPSFNSIVNNPTIGDERKFVKIGEINPKKTEIVNNAELKKGTQYLVYIYVHNNASKTYNDKIHDNKGIATGVRLSSSFPEKCSVGEKGVIRATLTSENANPKTVWDSVIVTTKENDVKIRYVEGSAAIYNDGNTNRSKLPTSLFSKSGVLIGFDNLDGIIPGCEEYHSVICYVIEAV